MTTRSRLSRDQSDVMKSRWLWRRVPIWSIAVFLAVLVLSFSPALLFPYGLHDDFDLLVWKTWTFVFWHIETPHLLSDARPIAAVLTNVPLLWVRTIADFRWVHVFSLFTLCAAAIGLLANCGVRLRLRPLDALVAALSIFLCPAFIYSVLDTSAWAPHLVTTCFVVWAYSILGRSNRQSIALSLPVTWCGVRTLVRRSWSYASSRDVVRACLVYQLAFYTYPPFALLMTVFPVITVFFSRASRGYRTLLAVRDTLFIAANMAIFVISTKLIYLPIIGSFIPDNTGEAGYAAYKFSYNFGLSKILGRIARVGRVAGDLWFLPQSYFLIVTATLFVLAIVIGTVLTLRRRAPSPEREVSLFRLGVASWKSEGILTLGILILCFLMASAPVWAAVGGFVEYRTVVAPTALAALVFVFSLRALAEQACRKVGHPLCQAPTAALAAMVLAACAAFGGNFYANYVDMRLGRNELAYFRLIVREAIEHKAKTIVLLDSRGPIKISPMYDERGRAVPPYELGCFGSYCVERGMIARAAAEQLGKTLNSFDIVLDAGSAYIPGLTCDMLVAPTPRYPPNSSQTTINTINHIRSAGPLSCATISAAWHDLSIDLDTHPDSLRPDVKHTS
jgi:hypothetical protein